jgi:hypothetical protein
MVTVPPDGMEAGAMKVAGPPLAVCRVMEPHSEAIAALQVTSQLTPRFAGSLLTVAANCVEEFAATEEGGAICPCAKVMLTGAGLVALHPLRNTRNKQHNIEAMTLIALIIRPLNPRFISIIFGNSLP